MFNAINHKLVAFFFWSGTTTQYRQPIFNVDFISSWHKDTVTYDKTYLVPMHNFKFKILDLVYPFRCSCNEFPNQLTLHISQPLYATNRIQIAVKY